MVVRQIVEGLKTENQAEGERVRGLVAAGRADRWQ